jgi:hypothetical protein
MKDLDFKRAKKTRGWKIPEKFLNIEFINFIMNINTVELIGKPIDKIPIQDDPSSIESWANHFQLWDLHGIDVESILELFSEKGCAQVVRNENYIKYHHQNLVYLQTEISARIDKN